MRGVVIVIVLSAVGCVGPVPVRSPSVLQQGEVTATIALTGTFTPAEAITTSTTGARQKTTNTGYLNRFLSTGNPALALASAMLHVSYGVADGGEVSVTLSASRLGLEGRVRLRDETTAGGGVSVAAVAGAYYLPWGGPEAIAGIDLGERVGSGHSLFTNVYASYGTEVHGMEVASDAMVAHDTSLARFKRTELRINAALGASFHFSSKSQGSGDVVVALVPYWTPKHGEAELTACSYCGAASRDATFEEDFGIGVVLGVGRFFPHN